LIALTGKESALLSQERYKVKGKQDTKV